MVPNATETRLMVVRHRNAKLCAGPCKRLLPRTFDYFYRRKARDGFQPRCKACDKARIKAYAQANPDKRREWDRAYRAKVDANPEIKAERLDYGREWMRRKRGTRPENYRVGNAPQVLVPSAPVLAAVESSGLLVTEIECIAGVGEGTLRKARERPTMRASTALAILGALSLDPCDVGI